MNKRQHKATECVHGGAITDSQYHGSVTPLYPATAYDYVGAESLSYPRYFNTPNQEVVAQKLALLEQGEAGVIFGSGMAAISTVLFALLKPGDHAVFQNDLYGGTHHAVSRELGRLNIAHDFTDGLAVDDFRKVITKATRLIYIETPSNPLLKITDIEGVATLAREHDIVTVIDNTFASPINQNPISLGIDIVLHSGTKYLGGHSDISCGAVICSQARADQIRQSAINFGGSLNPQMCHLLERSLKTLSLRVNQQNSNAQRIAEFLQQHDRVESVYYPGLTTHKNHSLASRQMSGFGGMLSFVINSDPDEFVQRLQLIKPAISLGGVESTICSPRQTSHAKLTATQREAAGISDSLLRLSVGIEAAADIIADLNEAL